MLIVIIYSKAKRQLTKSIKGDKTYEKLILMAMFLILCNLGFSKTFFEVSFNDGTSANLREKASNNSKILAKLETFDGGEVISH